MRLAQMTIRHQHPRDQCHDGEDQWREEEGEDGLSVGADDYLTDGVVEIRVLGADRADGAVEGVDESGVLVIGRGDLCAHVGLYVRGPDTASNSCIDKRVTIVIAFKTAGKGVD